MSKFLEEIGEKIKELRQAQGISQAALAERCGLTQPHLSRIERGKLSITAETLDAIAKGLNCHLEIKGS